MKKKIRLTFKVKKKRSETLKKCFLTTTKQNKIVIFFDFFWLFRFFGIIFILGKSIFLSKSKKSLKWRKKIRFFSEFFFRNIFPPVNDFLTCILHFMQFQKIPYFWFCSRFCSNKTSNKTWVLFAVLFKQNAYITLWI